MTPELKATLQMEAEALQELHHLCCSISVLQIKSLRTAIGDELNGVEENMTQHQKFSKEYEVLRMRKRYLEARLSIIKQYIPNDQMISILFDLVQDMLHADRHTMQQIQNEVCHRAAGNEPRTWSRTKRCFL